MAPREWQSTPLKTTPYRQKHYSLNLRNQRFNVSTLNQILSRELRGSTLQCKDSEIVDILLPDNVVGFPVHPAVEKLKKLIPFSEIDRPIKENPFLKHLTSEAGMTEALNHLIRLLSILFDVPHRRKWTAQNCSVALQGIHSRKPDIALCDDAVLQSHTASLASWCVVHTVIEINAVQPLKFKILLNTLRNKALLIFHSQPTRRYLITIWMTPSKFGIIYFDRAGEIRGRWDYSRFDVFIRLVGGVAFCPDRFLGYDPLVVRDAFGTVMDITIKELSYRVVDLIFSTCVLRGRGTSCFLVERDGNQFVIKDTWADKDRQSQEWQFLETCRQNNIPDVAQLVGWEDITIDGVLDSTSQRRRGILPETVEDRVHRRLVLQPICATIEEFASKQELLSALVTHIQAHEKLIKIGILHRDISLGNLALYCQAPHPPNEKCSSTTRSGCIIDFDYAFWLPNSPGSVIDPSNRTVSNKHKTGTLPFMSMEILNGTATEHTFQHDLESFLYVLLWICSTYTAPGKMRVGIIDEEHQMIPPIYEWVDSWAVKETHMRHFKRMVLPHFTEFFSDFQDTAQAIFNVMFPDTNVMSASKSTVSYTSFLAPLEAKLAEIRAESGTQPVASSSKRRKGIRSRSVAAVLTETVEEPRKKRQRRLDAALPYTSHMHTDMRTLPLHSEPLLKRMHNDSN